MHEDAVSCEKAHGDGEPWVGFYIDHSHIVCVCGGVVGMDVHAWDMRVCVWGGELSILLNIWCRLSIGSKEGCCISRTLTMKPILKDHPVLEDHDASCDNLIVQSRSLQIDLCT